MLYLLWSAMVERFSASDYWQSHYNMGSNPGHDCGACVLEQDTILYIASLHPGV